jgi:hypothetical protein
MSCLGSSMLALKTKTPRVCPRRTNHHSHKVTSPPTSGQRGPHDGRHAAGRPGCPDSVPVTQGSPLVSQLPGRLWECGRWSSDSSADSPVRCREFRRAYRATRPRTGGTQQNSGNDQACSKVRRNKGGRFVALPAAQENGPRRGQLRKTKCSSAGTVAPLSLKRNRPRNRRAAA